MGLIGKGPAKGQESAIKTVPRKKCIQQMARLVKPHFSPGPRGEAWTPSFQVGRARGRLGPSDTDGCDSACPTSVLSLHVWSMPSKWKWSCPA